MGERTANVSAYDLGSMLQELSDVIEKRKDASPDKSYTARLLLGKEDDLYKKLVEESVELVLAAKDKDHDHIRYEAADLLYHLLVVLARLDVSAAEVAGELKARMG